QKHHGGTGTAVAQLPDDLEAVQVGEHHVEHHEIGALLPGHLYRLGPVRRGAYRETGEAQGGGQQLEDIRIVLDHEQPRLTLRRTGQHGTPGLCPAVSYPHALILLSIPVPSLKCAWELPESRPVHPSRIRRSSASALVTT